MLPGTPRTFIGSTTFVVQPLTDATARAVVAAIAAVPGVESVGVDAASGTVTVRASEPVDRADIAEAVAATGCRLAP